MKFAEFKEKHWLESYPAKQKILQANLHMIFESIDCNNLEQLTYLLCYCNTEMLQAAKQKVGEPQLQNFEIRLAIKHRLQELESTTNYCIPIRGLTCPVIETNPFGTPPTATRYVIPSSTENQR